MTPKEQKLDYFTPIADGNIYDYIYKLSKQGYVVHQIIPDMKDSFYILLYKY